MLVVFNKPAFDALGVVIGESAEVLLEVDTSVQHLRDTFLKVFNPLGEYRSFRVEWLNNSAARAVILGYTQIGTPGVPIAVTNGIQAAEVTRNTYLADGLGLFCISYRYDYRRGNINGAKLEPPMHVYTGVTVLGQAVASGKTDLEARRGLADAVVAHIDSYLNGNCTRDTVIDPAWQLPGALSMYFDMGGSQLANFASAE